MDPKRILVVDDHADSRTPIVRVLRQKGYEVAEASTKAEALKLCKENSFDLLLGDIQLPDGGTALSVD